MHVNKCKNTVNECKYRLYTILHKTVSELCVHSVYKGDSHGWANEMLCKCCANLGIKKVKALKISTLTLAVVGITGLEPATSRPPDVCATNCAKSRSKKSLASDLSRKCGCKSTHIFPFDQIFRLLFSILSVFFISDLLIRIKMYTFAPRNQDYNR